MPDDPIEPLREALKHSPENVPLRKHIAELLLKQQRYDEAEKEFRESLAHSPHDRDLKLGLAKAFYHGEKNSEALVIIEDLIGNPDVEADAYILHCRLLIRSGNIEPAVREYKKAMFEDPSAADEDLEELLGIDNTETESDVVEGKARQLSGMPDSSLNIDIERPKLKFEDVGGMDDLKEEIRMKIIMPLEHPELYEAYGKAIGGGILMYGPPGCGKTHLARATAGEVKATFLSVGINDVLDMWIGQSEQKLHGLFQTARDNTPCVLFFDEVDALGASRTDMRQSAGRQLINQFLAELDGVEFSNDGILILAATNAPWHLDAAFRRPGRFDRILFVPPPDFKACEEILKVMLRDKPVDNVEASVLAKKAKGFSGADVKAVIDWAVEEKLKEAMKSGVPEPLRTRELLRAFKAVRPTTKEWFATARNYALYSNQGGLYDDILDYLNIKK
ncbi:MAG: AAA family ATPase [Planctomycetota bacterium]|nr:AAA family ATPase [Planctomycetota bacterium]